MNNNGSFHSNASFAHTDDTNAVPRAEDLPPTPSAGQRGVTPPSAAAATLAASMEVALRAEVKRLRDEVADLRRETTRLKSVEAENQVLRTVNLMQSEEKVPIRIKELELENQRLKRLQRSQEERIALLEGDRRYRELLSAQGGNPQQGGVHTQNSLENSQTSGSDPNGAWTFPSFASPPPAASHVNNFSMAVGNATIGSSRQVVVLRQGTDPCLQCSTRVAAVERSFDVERQKLRKENRDLQSQLDAATAEIRAVEAWVTPLVQTLQQYPRLAEAQPLQQLHNFASPTRYTGETAGVGSRVLGTPTTSLHAPPTVGSTSRVLWSGDGALAGAVNTGLANTPRPATVVGATYARQTPTTHFR